MYPWLSRSLLGLISRTFRNASTRRLALDLSATSRNRNTRYIRESWPLPPKSLVTYPPRCLGKLDHDQGRQGYKKGKRGPRKGIRNEWRKHRLCSRRTRGNPIRSPSPPENNNHTTYVNSMILHKNLLSLLHNPTSLLHNPTQPMSGILRILYIIRINSISVKIWCWTITHVWHVNYGLTIYI